MSILNIFSNDNIKTFAGLRINRNGFLEILELQKVNNSYSPVFWTKESFLNFVKEDGFLDKKKFIDFFKIIRTKTKNQNFKIYFQEFESKDNHLKITIQESLKIAGFVPQNKEVDKINTKGIILSNNLTENENVLYFYQNNLTFLQTEKGKVKHKEYFNILDLNAKKALKIINNLENKEIKLVGGFGELFRTTKNLLKACGADIKEVNVWQNVLSFSDVIPDISKEESQYIVEMLAFTVPKLRKWEYVPVKVKKGEVEFKGEKLENKVEKKAEKPKKEKKKLFLPKNKNKKVLLPKSKKKSLLPKKDELKSLPEKKDKSEIKEKTQKKKEVQKLAEKDEKIFLKKWKEKTQKEINEEIEKNIDKYADKDILFEEKSVDEKIKQYADFQINENDLINEYIDKYADKEIFENAVKSEKTFWQKTKNFFNKKIF